MIPRLLVTEKSISGAEKSAYVFQVPLNASKLLIAAAISDLYSVTVTNVRTNILRGKTKRLAKSRQLVKRPRTKKAYVQLKKGQVIPLSTEGDL